MKKIVLIISILSIIFLTGCVGLFNLSGWIYPDDLEFIATIEELKTPFDIGNYMAENFTGEPHLFYELSPYELWKTKKGDCSDMCSFGRFVAHYHNYETYQIEIFYKNASTTHIIAVYVESEGLSFTDSQYYFNNLGHFFKTFREIVEFDCSYYKEFKKYIVYDYENRIVETGTK